MVYLNHVCVRGWLHDSISSMFWTMTGSTIGTGSVIKVGGSACCWGGVFAPIHQRCLLMVVIQLCCCCCPEASEQNKLTLLWNINLAKFFAKRSSVYCLKRDDSLLRLFLFLSIMHQYTVSSHYGVNVFLDYVIVENLVFVIVKLSITIITFSAQSTESIF